MIIKYSIVLRDGKSFSGTEEADGREVSTVEKLPQGYISSVSAEIELNVPDDTRVFMNGYQTWTYCPEKGKYDLLRPMEPKLPKKLVEHFGLDRYGDYHFVKYPMKRGINHGESWCYFRRGDSFRLFASLDEKPGYTLFSYDFADGILRLERDCEGLRCGGDFHAFDLFICEGTENEVFDAWFAALGIKPRTTQRLSGYSSWYNRYQDISSRSITEDLNGCAPLFKEGDLFQIDDGWEPFIGDWLEEDKKKFPEGLKPMVEQIHDRGFKAGLWLAPFVAQKGSALMREHPDWLLQVEGKPWYCGSNWGGFYSLDIDNPEVIDYIRRTFDRVLNEWGFDLVKLDFLYGAAPFGSDRETRAGRMIRAMELLRECCGDKLILGCGVPLMPAFGLVDYCRVSCDVGLDWDDTAIMQLTHRERVSTRQAIGNSIFRRELNGRAWLNDPDVFFLRENNLKLTAEQKRKLYTVNSLLGGILLNSDDMSKYSPEMIEQYRQILAMRDASDVRVDADKGLSVSYEFGGQRYSVKIE